MRTTLPALGVSIGSAFWPARLRRDLAPVACAAFEALLPYRVRLIQARWSGEAAWAPLGTSWPAGAALAREHPVHAPEPGQVLLYAGPLSEPELLVPYGPCRFACSAGPLEGEPVLSLDDPAGLAAAGRDILWNGAAELRIERS